MYIADDDNHVVRRIDASTSVITTAVGVYPGPQQQDHYTGDGGPAKLAGLSYFEDVAMDSAGNLYIADGDNGVVRKVSVAAGIASFGSVDVGSSSPAMDVTLTNIGNAALNLSGSVPSTEFNVSGTHTSCGASTPLAVDASCILGIEFMPTSPGAQMGSVTLTDDAYNNVTSTQSVALLGTGVAPIPSQVVLGAVPSTAVSGGNLGIISATVEDANANTVTSSTAAVTATITGPNGYSQTVTAAAVNGVASLNLSSLNLTTAGTYTVTTSSSGLTAASSTVTVTAGAASKLVSGAVPATVVSGGNLGTISATVEDASGNTVTSSTAAVTATITGPNGYSQTVTAAAVNGLASLNLSSLNLATAGTYTVTTSSAGLTLASSTVTVTAGAAAKLVSGAVPTTLTAGGNLGTLTATVEDASGNTVTSSTAAMTATITGPNGYSQTVTTAAVNGVASLNLSSLSLTTAGVYTVTTSGAGLACTSSTVIVTAGTASKIALGAVPTSIAPGQNLGTTTATVEDANGNPVTSSTTAIIATITGPNGYSQMVSGTSVNGVVNLNLSSLAPTAAGSYTLTVSGAGLAPVSTTITVAEAMQTIPLPSLPNVSYGAGATTLPPTTSAGLPITYTVTGPATLNGSSLAITGAGTVTLTATQAGDASHSPVTLTKSFTVAQATSTTTLSSSSGVASAGSSVTLTTQVASTAGTPTGTVAFLNGATVLGTAPVSSTGAATLTVATLPTGVLSLTAAYSGDANFLASVSAIAVADVQDFGIAPTGGTPSVPVVPGAATGFTLALTPGTAGFSSAITLTATGLPAGATYSFSPAMATPGAATATTVLTVQTTKPVATARNLGAAAGITLALLVLPLGVSRKRREALKRTRLLSAFGVLLLLGGAAGLSGCGSSNGFFGQPAQSYTITVTGTSGSLTHSTTVVLNLQ